MIQRSQLGSGRSTWSNVLSKWNFGKASEAIGSEGTMLCNTKDITEPGKLFQAVIPVQPCERSEEVNGLALPCLNLQSLLQCLSTVPESPPVPQLMDTSENEKNCRDGHTHVLLEMV
ncbi:hypothetical protein BTVI_38234 [Pitangus sulphuratus]|nr:hypothetical protein BTVI_38234 [Pitangus sulphuratus]